MTIAGHSRTTSGTQRLRYTCQRDPSRPERGGLSIDATQLEDYITGRVLHRLAHPRASSNTASPSALLAQVTMINERIHQLDQDRRDGLITTGEHRAGMSAAEDALTETSRQLVATGGAIALHTAPIGDREALQSWWETLDTTDRHVVITTLISALRISPGQPGRRFDPSRIRITYRR